MLPGLDVPLWRAQDADLENPLGALRRSGYAMRYKSLLATAFLICWIATTLQRSQPPPAPWRGAGPTPCVGSDGGIFQCPPAPQMIAVRAGRMFDSKSGQMLRGQVVRASGRANHRSRPGGPGKDSRGRAGDRPEPGDRAARLDRRAHAYVQHARTEGNDAKPPC